MNQHPVPCALCGSLSATVLYKPWNFVDDPVKLFGAAAGERGTQQIVRCAAPGCGLVFASPRYPDDVIATGYTEAGDDGHDTQYGSRVLTFLKSLEKHSRWLPPKGSRALDVGCAGGAFVQAAKTYGYNAEGRELSKRLVKSARSRGLNVSQGPLESLPREGAYDLITLWDVLEHVTDPNHVLEECRIRLKPGGTFLLNVPDVGTWQAKLAGKHFWWFLSVHLNYFDKKTLPALLRKHGFEVMHIGRHIQRLELGYLFEVGRIYSRPLARLAETMTPAFMKKWLIPYYASQTTFIAR
jgi:SAM-dependent methyltransferase